MRDMTGTECTHCFAGRYRETSLHDDIDGVLHCDVCLHQIKRWKTAEEMGLPEMLPCPHCGFHPDVCNEDALYPVGRDRKVWQAVCYETGGGCSAHVLGHGPNGAINGWNARVVDTVRSTGQLLIEEYDRMSCAMNIIDYYAARTKMHDLIRQLKKELSE